MLIGIGQLLEMAGLVYPGLRKLTCQNLTKHYFDRANKELADSLATQTRRLENQETLEEFAKLLSQAEWEKNFVGQDPVFVCKSKPTFQFDMLGEREEFYEDWMKVFPDRNGRAFDLNLKIRGTTVKTLRFISGDGGRYTLPLPEVYLVDSKQAFVWRKNSLGYKVASVIGNFYRCDSLEEVGRFVGVDVITEQRHA
ncbi:MAG: hypothetical protein ACJA09_003134 [Alcanivorax sp.]